MKNELLEKIFSNVNNWLNFAEAKNALLVGFLVAGFGLHSHLKEEFPPWCLNICLVLALSALAFPLLSFFPLQKKVKERVVVITSCFIEILQDTLVMNTLKQ